MLEVSFKQATYSVSEGDSVSITVTMSPDTDRDVEIPVTIGGDAETGDYEVSGLSDGKLSFASGDSSKSFTITTEDDSDRGDETLDLEFGEFPDAVSAETQAAAVAASRFPPPRTNRQPEFTESGLTGCSEAENSESSANIGTPVSATDPDGDELTYTLGGDDAASFNIDSSTGQLKTSAALDFEVETAYYVTMFVFDTRGGRDSIVVTT